MVLEEKNKVGENPPIAFCACLWGKIRRLLLSGGMFGLFVL